MDRVSKIHRKTKETDVHVELNLDGTGPAEITTGIPFLDHMLILFSVHGFFQLTVAAKGDLDVDFHHTVEDVGIVIGDAIDQALGDRKGIRRYGYAVTPMDDALADVAIDLSKRPFLVYNVPAQNMPGVGFDVSLAREFFRAFANHGKLNLHINLRYGENEHHIIESVYKAAGQALDQATSWDPRISGVRSSKGTL